MQQQLYLGHIFNFLTQHFTIFSKWSKHWFSTSFFGHDLTLTPSLKALHLNYIFYLGKCGLQAIGLLGCCQCYNQILLWQCSHRLRLRQCCMCRIRRRSRQMHTFRFRKLRSHRRRRSHLWSLKTHYFILFHTTTR